MFSYDERAQRRSCNYGCSRKRRSIIKADTLKIQSSTFLTIIEMAISCQKKKGYQNQNRLLLAGNGKLISVFVYNLCAHIWRLHYIELSFYLIISFLIFWGENSEIAEFSYYVIMMVYTSLIFFVFFTFFSSIF